MEQNATGMSAGTLGLDGFVVLAAVEYGGELELLVENTDTVTGCSDCHCSGPTPSSKSVRRCRSGRVCATAVNPEQVEGSPGVSGLRLGGRYR